MFGGQQVRLLRALKVGGLICLVLAGYSVDSQGRAFVLILQC